MKPTLIMLAALAVLLALPFCTPRTQYYGGRSDLVAVTVQSTSRAGGRDPNVVRFYCRGSQIGVVRDLSSALVAKYRLRLNENCRLVQFRVETHGFNPDTYTTEEFYLQPGDSLDIKINPILAATYYMVYHDE